MALGPLTNLEKDIEDSTGKSGNYANIEGNCQPPAMTHFCEIGERAHGPTRALHQRG